MPQRIGKLIEDAFQKLTENNTNLALISVCVAVDATAKAEHPAQTGNRARYRTFLTDNISLITFVSTGGMIVGSRSRNTPLMAGFTIPGSKPPCDLEEVLYREVRCSVIHEGGLPPGIEVGPGLDTSDPLCLKLPSPVISGLILAVIGSPSNKDQRLPEEWTINLSGNLLGKTVKANDFWGKKDELCDFLGIP